MNDAQSQGPNQNTFIELEYAKEMNIKYVPIPSFCPIALFRVFCMRHPWKSFEEIRAKTIALEILRRGQLFDHSHLKPQLTNFEWWPFSLLKCHFLGFPSYVS